MGATQGQTQAMQAGAAIPGNLMNAAMSGYSMGGGFGGGVMGNMAGMMGPMMGGSMGGQFSSFTPQNFNGSGGFPYRWAGG
jgi:hypothetical protein